jgi:type I restriction enzyme, S subunit
VNNTEGWKVTTIEECCDILDSKRIPVNAEERESRIGEIPYYGANGLQGYIDDYIFEEDLILIAEDGGCFDEFATRAIAYKISGKSWVNNHAHVLKAKQYYSQNFIFYSLEHKDIQSFIVGGTRAKLNQTALRSIQLSLPDKIEEQTQIAAVLSRIDLAITQTEAIIAKQQRLKTGLMQDLLTKGIDENGNIRSEATHDFKDSVIGRIPVEWEVSPLDALIEIIDCKHFTPSYVKEGIPIIRPRNIKDHGFDFKDIDFVSDIDYQRLTDKHEPKQGDIVFSRDASFGIPVYVEHSEKFCIGQDVVIMTRKNASTKFIFTALKSDCIFKQIHLVSGGSTFGRIDLAAIRELLIKVPQSIQEQNRIAKIINQMDILQTKTKSDLKKMQSFKTGLMQDLLTGKVRVTPLLEKEPASR